MNEIVLPRFVLKRICLRTHLLLRRFFAIAAIVSHDQRGRAMGRSVPTGRLGGTGAGRWIGRVQHPGFGADVDG